MAVTPYEFGLDGFTFPVPECDCPEAVVVSTTPTVALCDDLVAYLTALATPGVSDSYERAYFVRTADSDDAELKLVVGRRVRICPSLPEAYTYEGYTRGEDIYTHKVSVLVETRYTDAAGDPTTDWIDEQTDWVYTNIVLGFDFDKRDGNGPAFNRNLVTQGAQTQLFDLDTLLKSGLFSSQVDITFQELVDV